MSKKYESPLLLKLKPSVRLNWVIGLMYLLALGACISNSLPIILKCSLFTGVSIYLWFVIKRLKNTPHTIKYSEALGWEISQDNHFESVRVLPSTVITIFGLFLHITSYDKDAFRNLWDANKKTVLILPDMLNEEEYRCLIVKLKTTAMKQQRLIASVDKI